MKTESSASLTEPVYVHILNMILGQELKTGDKVPEVAIAVNLDHGADFEICKSCIDGGFTSVMIDGSHYSFEENITLTRKVVEYAHSKGVVVEGELGKLAGIEDDVKVASADASYIRPEEVEEFIARTRCGFFGNCDWIRKVSER